MSNFDSSKYTCIGSVGSAIPYNPQPFWRVVVRNWKKQKQKNVKKKNPNPTLCSEVDLPISTMELPTVGFIFEQMFTPGTGWWRGEREKTSLSGGYLGLGFGQRSGY